MNESQGIRHVRDDPVHGSEAVVRVFEFMGPATELSCESLVAKLSTGFQLGFWDQEFGPAGGYACVERLDSEFVAKCADYGWSTAWIPITRAEVIAWLIACADSPSAPDGRDVFIVGPILDPASKVSRWRWSTVRRYLKRRIREG
jgi:uncharacterized protein YbjT (DUF2867 family)